MAIAYSLGDPLRLLEDMQLCTSHEACSVKIHSRTAKPTAMIAVPRILNRLYGVIHGQTVGASGVKGALARRAFSTKLANFKSNGRVHHPLYDRLMMNKIKAVLGGRIKLIGTGAAPLSPDVLDFLQVRLFLQEEFSTETHTTTGRILLQHSRRLRSNRDYRLFHQGPSLDSACQELNSVTEYHRRLHLERLGRTAPAAS
jgi:hypothetical protein